MSAKNVWRTLANWGVMAFVAAVLYVFIMLSYRQGEPSIAGKKAEDFPLTVAGKQTRLSEFRGKVVVLNFWASWCGSCVEEMPDLDRLQARIRSRGGIVLAVSVDENCVIDREGFIARKIIGPQQWDSAEMTGYFDATLARN